jgi:hypothetical protein
VEETVPDLRLSFASLLRPGGELTLARADGPMVDTRIATVTGVDLELVAPPRTFTIGGLSTVRMHDGESAWFATMMVIDVADSDEVATVRVRIGDAMPVTSERWTERVAFVGPAVLRPESGLETVVRAESLNASLTGVALRVREGAPAVGVRVGVVIAGDGDGSIAFRGRVSRSSRTSHGAVLGVEIIGISRDDHRRLERAIARRAT